MASTRTPRDNPPVGHGRPEAPARISIRRIDAVDGAALSDFYVGLSPASRHDRFLGTSGDAAVRANADRLADMPGWVAVRGGAGPDDGRLVGHVVLVPGGPGIAELAVAVADDVRGRGIGTRLVAAALDGARRCGLRRLEATTYADNVPMRRLLAHTGAPIVRDSLVGGVEEVELALA